MKQKLPIKGLELYLNVSNPTEALTLPGSEVNPYDPDFDDSIYDEILDPSLFSYFDPTGGDDGSGERVGLNPDIAELLSRVPRGQRAKSQEQHYGRTIDIGFRFAFRSIK